MTTDDYKQAKKIMDLITEMYPDAPFKAGEAAMYKVVFAMGVRHERGSKEGRQKQILPTD